MPFIYSGWIWFSTFALASRENKPNAGIQLPGEKPEEKFDLLCNCFCLTKTSVAHHLLKTQSGDTNRPGAISSPAKLVLTSAIFSTPPWYCHMPIFPSLLLTLCNRTYCQYEDS